MGFEYGYRFARQAAADVTGIVDYLAGDLANPTAAASFKKSLMECLDTLRMFPQSGSLVQNGYVPQTGIREKLVTPLPAPLSTWLWPYQDHWE